MVLFSKGLFRLDYVIGVTPRWGFRPRRNFIRSWDSV